MLFENGFKLKALLAALASIFAAYWNSLPEVLQGAAGAALILLVVDTILGILQAVCEHKYNAEGLFKFFKKSIVYTCVCAAAYAMDLIFRAQAFAQTIVVLMIVATELQSIMEHSEALGFHWPVAIRERLLKLLKAVGCSDEQSSCSTQEKGDGRNEKPNDVDESDDLSDPPPGGDDSARGLV